MLTYIFVQSAILFGKFITVITKRNGIIIFIAALVASTKYFELVPAISGEKSICASPRGDPAEILKMLVFCSRHGIELIIEEFPLSHVKEAKAPLKSGKARYRGRRYKGSKVLRINSK
jgi:D-arabinose 1-dehydrogenase-like Zn-dependent alcohol dehydrogenase